MQECLITSLKSRLPFSFFCPFLFPADWLSSPLRKSFYLLINFLRRGKKKEIEGGLQRIPIISPRNAHANNNPMKMWPVKREKKPRCRSLYCMYKTRLMLRLQQRSRSTGRLYPARLKAGEREETERGEDRRGEEERERERERKKRNHHSLPVGCLVDSDERSSRFTGAHWRTRSFEPSAQSQDPQSPQPIRGYTGGLGAAGGWGKVQQ